MTIEELLSRLSRFTDLDRMIEYIRLISQYNRTLLQNNNDDWIFLRSLADFCVVFAEHGLVDSVLQSNQKRKILELFTQVKFTQQQLLSLLIHLRTKDVNDLILKSNGISKADLLRIVNDYDQLQKIGTSTKTLLYAYFNPKREWKSSCTPLLEMFYTTMRTSHVLGLDEKISFSAYPENYKLKTVGQHAAISLTTLLEYVDLYRQQYPAKIADAVFEAFQYSVHLMVPHHTEHKMTAEQNLLKRYQSNQLTYLTAGWHDYKNGHVVGLSFYGYYLIYTNRGDGGDTQHGSKIFKIKDTSLINEALFKKLGSYRLKSTAEFHTLLSTIVDLNKPLVKFPCKGQKNKTCSFANPKAHIEPMIVMFKVGPFATEDQLKIQFNQYMAENRSKYKSFSRFVRDLEIDELIRSMFYAHNFTLIHYYAALTKSIIRNHHGANLIRRDNKKDEEEIERAYDLYTRLPQKIKIIVETDENFMKLMNNIKRKYYTLFEPPEFLMQPHSKYVRFSRYELSAKVNIEKGNIVSINGRPTPKMHFSYRQARKLIPAFC